MRKLGMLILLLAMACSKAQLPLGVEPVSTLEVTAIDPEGRNVDSAKVFLNGKLVGMTPYRNEELKTGLIAIRVEKEGFRLFTSQLVVQQEQSYSIEAVLTPLDPTEGELLITVNQDSALVKVKDANDNVVVETYERTSKHVLPAGAYVVSAEKPGFPMAVQAVNVVVGQTVSVHLELIDNSQPPNLDFQVVEDTVEVGSMVTLTWQSDGVRVIIDQGIGERGPSGTEKMVCTEPGNKVFTATAYSADDVATERKDSVYVVPKTVIPPILEFDASPDTLMFGEPVLLQWHSDGFQVAIDQGVGLRGPDGTEEVFFQNPGKKVFTAIASGEDNARTTKQDSVFVKELPAPPLPVVVISATSQVTVDSVATITWFTQNADYVVVDYVDNPQLQGSAEVVFSTPGIRIVTATAFNSAGFASASDTIEVVEPEVNPVDDIIVAANVSVRADRGEAGFADLGAASVQVETPGRYRVVAEVWYNSGDSQLNESYYLEMRDGGGTVELPHDANAGIHRVVADEPGEPHTASRNSGTFRLTAGTHQIDVYHYAKIADIYPQFLNGPITGPESVKILGFRLVYVGE